MKLRSFYGAILAGSFVGLTASFLQTLEKLQLAENASKPLVCDINSVFSCSDVLNSWQSSVMGFPNSIMCMFIFTVLLTIGIAGLAGSKLSKSFRLGAQALALGVLVFGLWYLSQTIFVVNALCIYCLFCMVGLLAVNWALLRININDLPLNKDLMGKLQKHILKGTDIFGWFLVAAAIALAMLIQFH